MTRLHTYLFDTMSTQHGSIQSVMCAFGNSTRTDGGTTCQVWCVPKSKIGHDSNDEYANRFLSHVEGLSHGKDVEMCHTATGYVAVDEYVQTDGEVTDCDRNLEENHREKAVSTVYIHRSTEDFG